MDEKDTKINAEDLEIEPLSDDAIDSIAGGADAAVIRDPCLANSCSAVACSSTDID